MLITVVEARTFLRMSDGSFELLSECANSPLAPCYVEGAIELVVENVEILGLSEWDLVDQLWAYIVEMLHRFRVEDRVGISFPDSPIKLTLQRTSPGRVLVSRESDETRRIVAIESELIETLTEEAARVLEKMSEMLPGNAAA